MRVVMTGSILLAIDKKKYFSPIINPSPEDVDHYLSRIASRFGGITLELKDVPEEMDADLNLFSQRGEYFLILNEKWDNGSVRTYDNKNAPDEFVEVHGAAFHARGIFHDIEIARAALVEFCRRGTVSKSLLG